MAQFPSPTIARKSFDYRTLGLGYANLGALFMAAVDNPNFVTVVIKCIKEKIALYAR